MTFALQAELMRISRINFSEGFQLLVHLKIVRTFVESILRYGLPTHYFSCIIKVRLITSLLYDLSIDTLGDYDSPNPNSPKNSCRP